MNAVVVAALILMTSTFLPRLQPPSQALEVSAFDVLEIPARIDQPQLEKAAAGYLLKCALANRSAEQIVGLRLTLMLEDASSHGHFRRVTWEEPAEVAAHSIETLSLHPPIKTPLKAARIFLGVDDVTGHETIWHVVNADKLLAAYARGDHGLIANVRTVANKFDPRSEGPILAKPKPER